MQRTSETPDSCGGRACILWNVVRREVSTDLRFPTCEIPGRSEYLVGSDDLRKENSN